MESRPRVQEIELYRRQGRWQFSVLEVPLARSCGPLPDVDGGANFEEAEESLLALLDSAYQPVAPPVWRETNPDWWISEIHDST